MRVLIVDDNRDTVQTLGILLRSEGMEVQMLEGGAEVLQVARDFRPDVVLLDIGMPERNGYEVARDLRRQFGPEHPKLVAVTAYSGIAAKCEARASGFDHYVAKPYNPVALLDLVNALQRRAG